MLLRPLRRERELGADIQWWPELISPEEEKEDGDKEQDSEEGSGAKVRFKSISLCSLTPI